jgi:O-antigen ligase
MESPFREWVGRGRGPFLNPVTNGMYMIAGLVAWAMFWPRANHLGKVALSAAMGLVLIGIYATLTRSCWLAAAAALGLVCLAAMPKYWRPPVLVAATLALALVFVIKAESFRSFKRDESVSAYDMEQSAKLRPMLAFVAWEIAKDYPLFGCGFGLYRKVNIDYLHNPTVDYPLQRLKPFVQHNVVLSLLAETGFLGAGLYLALLAGWFHRACRVWNNQKLPLEFRQSGLLFVAFLVQWLIQGMFHDTSLMVNANLLLFLLAGISQGVFAGAGAHQNVRGGHDLRDRRQGQQTLCLH